MAKQIELKAQFREETGKKSKKVRLQGLIPAVVYGPKIKSTAIAVESKEFANKVLQSGAGRNLIFGLKAPIEGKAQSLTVITQAIQRNPLNDQIVHLDFKQVIMDEAMKAKVRIEFIGGVPTGVKDGGGVLIHGLRELEIKCLPADIPDFIEVDVSQLEINHSIHVEDLKVPKNIEVLSGPTVMVASVTPPTKEEEVTPAVPTPEEAAAAAAAAGEAAAPLPGAEAAAGAEKAPAQAAPAKDKAAAPKGKQPEGKQ